MSLVIAIVSCVDRNEMMRIQCACTMTLAKMGVLDEFTSKDILTVWMRNERLEH